ncbi:MAG TPA: FkbM family methyltransferase [Myxococcales bacterium]|nr:FkbM family methyltransferase [Myxococcales bacterium]
MTKASPSPAPRPPLWASVCAGLVRRLPAGRYRLMSWLSARSRPARFVARLDAGLPLRYECDLRNALAREVFFTGQYEPQETVVLKSLLVPGGTFVDVGAHWGYFSLLAAGLVGAFGRVIAVEADPRIHATLAANLALNKLSWVTAHHAAIAAGDGTVELVGYSDAQENWGLSRIADARSAKAAAPDRFWVPARALDDLLDELRAPAVDLVKMDIEGAEGFALQGMQRGLKSGRYRRLLLELHPAELRGHGMDPRALLEQLLSLGYRGLTIDHSPGTTRRAAYDRHFDARDALRALDVSKPLDAWPHTLWLAPGIAPPPGVG